MTQIQMINEDLNELEKRILRIEKNGVPGVRDFFATSALSMLARENTIYWSPKEVAEKAYAIADAMMAKRG